MLEQVPSALVSGDLWTWTRSLSDYPAGTWSATWYFENSTAAFNVAATASGTDHVASVAATTTATYTAGRYRWRLVVTSGATRTTVESGWVTVEVDPAVSANYDRRSHARKVVDAIEAVIEGRATQDQMSMSIRDRTLARTPIADLLLLRDRYRAEVRAEENAERLTAGLASRNRLQVRFTR